MALFTTIQLENFLTNQIAAFFKFGPIKLIYSDNPTRKFVTNRIAAFLKFGPIKLIYSEKTPSRVKKQLVIFQQKNLCQNETSNLLSQLDKNFLCGLSSRIQFVV
jgi:hypothetical protein